jgi:hypothetical protein
MVWFIKSTQYFPKAVMEPYAGQLPSGRIYFLIIPNIWKLRVNIYVNFSRIPFEKFPFDFYPLFISQFPAISECSSYWYGRGNYFYRAQAYICILQVSIETYWTRIKHFPYVGHQVLAESPRQGILFLSAQLVNLVNDARAVHVRIKKLKWWARDSAAEDFSTSCPVEAKVLIIAYSLLTTE